MIRFFQSVFIGLLALISTSVYGQTDQFTIDSINESSFYNVYAEPTENGAVVHWSIRNDAYAFLKNRKDLIVITYNTSMGAKRNDKGYSGTEWKYSTPISLDSNKYVLTDLVGSEKYVFKVGIAKNGDLDQAISKGNSKDFIWSDKQSFKTKRGWGVAKFLILIGSLGLFIYGMKLMSEGLQQAAGSKLRNMLGSITSNRVKGVLTGFGITSIVQSSSVTTVMTVSFVNAGLLTLVQSAGVMMGANIGTTITGWLINIFGFKVSLASYAFMIIAIGAPFMFFGKRRFKAWASAIIGFALLFMGLGELKDAVPNLGPDSGLVQFFIDYKDIPVISTLFFVALGALVTIVVQSSSAAMALTMTMVENGIIPFEVACAMILGENIGTTITAELASTIGNVHAKRSARIHSLFNVIGVTWMVIVFPLFINGISLVMGGLGWGDPFNSPDASNTGLALFHTVFNTANVLLLIWFVPQLVRFSIKTVKSRGESDEEFHLDYIGTGIMSTPELSLLEAKKEVAKFGKITSRMSGFTQKLLVEQDRKNQKNYLKRIQKYEEITDRVEIEIANYLSKVSEGEMSEETSVRVRGMNSITNDLERIGDIFYQMSKGIERKNEQKVWFSPNQRQSLKDLFQLMDKAFEVMIDNLNADFGKADLNKAQSIELEINEKRDEMRKQHLSDLERADYNFESGLIYNDLFSSCEKIGDHIINVTEALKGKI